MDINAILPLLLSNINKDSPNKDSSGIDNTKLIQSLLSGEGIDNSSLINSLAKTSNNPQMATMISLAQSLNKQNKSVILGLNPIIPFVNNDIMGKLTKFFNK